MAIYNRRTLLGLLPAVLRPAQVAPQRRPELMIVVLDDSRHQTPMATVSVWLEKDYNLQEVVRQMAADLAVCKERA